jgi:3-carboxy-cis,cis-muconate cycloisomerase
MRKTAVFSAAPALLDAMIADHERSTGPWEIEWIALPEAFMLTAVRSRIRDF